jgi:acetylglutamate kinase
MIPKLQACLETLDKGVRKIHIIDGRLRHSLLLEVYTSRGVGTEIVREQAAGRERQAGAGGTNGVRPAETSRTIL